MLIAPASRQARCTTRRRSRWSASGSPMKRSHTYSSMHRCPISRATMTALTFEHAVIEGAIGDLGEPDEVIVARAGLGRRGSRAVFADPARAVESSVCRFRRNVSAAFAEPTH